MIFLVDFRNLKFSILLLSWILFWSNCGLAYSEALFEPIPLKCPSVENVRSKAMSCEKDNRMWTDAADYCLKRLNKIIDIQTKKMSRQLRLANKKNLDSAINKQKQNFIGTDVDYEIAQKNLDMLIDIADRTETQIDDYKHNVYFPEEWDEPEEIIGNRIKYVESQPCYSETLKAVRNILDKTTSAKESLIATKKASLALKGNTNALEVTLAGIGSDAVAAKISTENTIGLRANRSGISQEKRVKKNNK